MRRRQSTFEVYLAHDGRWTIDSVHHDKGAALERAQALAGGAGGGEAVRVAEVHASGREDTVFEAQCPGRKEPPITVTGIDSAPLCRTVLDVYGFESRKTLDRLLRRYLDREGITALELLHDPVRLKDVARMETFANQAVQRLATIQARGDGETVSGRADALYRLFTEIAERARDAEDPTPWAARLERDGLDALLAALPAGATPDYRASLIGQALRVYLGTYRDWTGKLTRVVGLGLKAAGDEARALVDELCAEILLGREAVRELLGAQPDLASALSDLARLGGRQSPSFRYADPCLRDLARLIGRADLPRTREVLLGRVADGIAGLKPLTRQDDEADRHAVAALVDILVAPGGLWGGPDMAEALIRRTRVVFGTPAADLSAEDGLGRVLARLPNNAVKLGCLLDLSASAFAERHQSLVLRLLAGLVESLSSVADLLPGGSSPEDLAAAVADLRRRLGTGLLSPEMEALLARKFDRMLGGTMPTAKVTAAPRPSAPKVERRAQPPNTYLFRQGDPGDEAYLIAEGSVEIEIETPDGPIPVATLRRGDIVGEMALVDDQPRMASARTGPGTVLTVIPRTDFKRRLDRLAESDRVLFRLMEVLVERLRANTAGE